MSMSQTRRTALLASFCIAVVLTGCAGGTQVTRVQPLAEAASPPYENILVVALLGSYDNRRYLEKELVTQLTESGTKAVASTSMMNTKTPMIRQTFVDMVDKINADAVLVSQLKSVESTENLKTMRPEATYNFRPTWYYNVWSVDLDEYVAPPSMQFSHSMVLATQLLTVSEKDTVWAIESAFVVEEQLDQLWSYSVFINQAKAISSAMNRDRLISR
jgi:hypothetical protein